MLVYLKLENFAIVEELEVEFGLGLTAITGETGAGKSLLVNALEFVLGGRLTGDVIRHGSDSTTVEAAFDVPLPPTIEVQWREAGLELEPDELLVLRRQMRSEGKGRAWLNGVSVPLREIRALGDFLVDIHGQHEHQSLLKASSHLVLLDAFSDSQDLAQEVARLRGEWDQLKREMERLQGRASERQQRMDFLQYEVKEIEKADLDEEEEEALVEERNRLCHVERLGECAAASLQAVGGSDSESPCARDLLAETLHYLEEAATLDPGLEDPRLGCERALAETQDVLAALEKYVADLEADPRRLEEVEGRLALISRLKKKFGDSVPEILGILEKLRAELEELSHAEERIPELKEAEAELLQGLKGQADVLSGCRRAGAMRLGDQVSKELTELGLSQAVFEASLERQEEGVPSRTGWEGAEFLFSANPGQPPRPLRHVASGGEMSRVMMALKTVLSKEDQIPTLVFDEVDANVGGRLGDVIGQKLDLLSQNRQVLCITHLPQVAARARQHLRVNKRVMDDSTQVDMEALSGETRVKEIASMLAGDAATEITMAQAAELLRADQGGKG